MKKLLSVLLCLCMVFPIAGCRGKSEKTNNMIFSTHEKTVESSLAETDTSEKVFLSPEGVEYIHGIIDDIDVEFPYSDLYETEECYTRLQTKVNVQSHKYSALNASGVLEGEHLFSIVKTNNEAYLEENTFGYEPLDDGYMLQICNLITDTVTEMKNRIPDIDYDRVYCNLGNLKILYKTAMVDNAQVTSEMVLNISPTMFQVVDLMTDENGCRDVVIHEIMHIIQTGCSCEETEHCTRRCGISFFWDDFEFNTSDFRWLFEGSAERSMCNLTGDELFTYENMINYICSLNMCTVLKEDVPANYAETLSFYSDVNNLYDMFDCETKEDIFEILNMMIAVNIIQTQPDELLSAYGMQYNVNVEEQAVLDDLNCTLKPAVVTVFAKNFYGNLADALEREEGITLNDACYLVALFEATLSYHTKYMNENYDKYNSEFKALYKSLRSSVFDRIKADCGVDISSYYNTYSVYENEGTKTVNASLKWCDADKALFFLERTDYLEYHINSKIM